MASNAELNVKCAKILGYKVCTDPLMAGWVDNGHHAFEWNPCENEAQAFEVLHSFEGAWNIHKGVGMYRVEFWPSSSDGFEVSHKVLKIAIVLACIAASEKQAEPPVNLEKTLGSTDGW